MTIIIMVFFPPSIKLGINGMVLIETFYFSPEPRVFTKKNIGFIKTIFV